MVMAELKLLHPEWVDVPYQVKRTSVRDACRAMSNVKQLNRELAAARAKGQRLDEPFAQLRFRSRKNPRQSCYIPDDAVTEHGVYHTLVKFAGRGGTGRFPGYGTIRIDVSEGHSSKRGG